MRIWKFNICNICSFNDIFFGFKIKSKAFFLNFKKIKFQFREKQIIDIFSLII